MVWDGENAVGLNKLLFLYINVYSVHFVILFSLVTLGVSHLALSWDVLHRLAGVTTITIGGMGPGCAVLVGIVVRYTLLYI